ncbi:MAG: helix-turn-helix transcriptional regulator [Ligilactobacillus salivarius]|nr:helix-turn-helix transcriptional regulator [Ligilactobacillus salivarius]MDY5247384.1 helix-turn-helix transcriptional regulator [Ligilactobacillus salivarius]
MSIELGKRLENLRESKGWNKTYVSKKIGLKTMQTYANYEYGSREPDLETLKELAELYGVSVDYLLGKPTQTETVKTADIEDDDVIFTYEGRQIPKEDLELIRRIMRGTRNDIK